MAIILLSGTFSLSAQPPHPEGGRPGAERHEPPRFNPEEFQRHFNTFVAKRAGLTEAEAKRFFPIFHDLRTGYNRPVADDLRQHRIVQDLDVLRFLNDAL